MNSIGEKIAELRKSKNMTQEELASTIGVSAQSISKWENSATMPDIMLLPVIADIFEISIDELFGRKNKNIASSAVVGDILDEARKSFLTFMQKYWHYTENDSGMSFEEKVDISIRRLKENPDSQTTIIRDSVVLFYKENIGGLMLNRPDNGWLNYMKDESAYPLLNALSDKLFMKLFIYILQNSGACTAASLAKKNDIPEADVKLNLENMLSLGMISRKDLDVEEGILSIYELCCTQKLYHILSVFAFAHQFVSQKEYYFGYMGKPDFYLN
ncbi:MAG: hypothetical protein A2Y17_10890 [Clostridiales bacterium GWF2_38_85]|nr:MAG: hypothetical protein A2Y17_10890 [Clostridiales bacterium GWF2_38_85]HBL84633.1 hypothetical protein [Clostridiales bacterium]